MTDAPATHCHCRAHHPRRRIVLTGGPGAGKTAVLELARKVFCSHVHVLPEAASLLFGGGFPRLPGDIPRRAAQRAIFYVQRELETAVDENPAITLCDRGTLDGIAYWPDAPDSFVTAVGTTRAEQLARYDVVIHLRTPTTGFDHSNPLRLESAQEAALLDARIEAAWEGHPHRHFVNASSDFLEKVARTLEILRGEMPACCRLHAAQH